jgi:hypothetical protein
MINQLVVLPNSTFFYMRIGHETPLRIRSKHEEESPMMWQVGQDTGKESLKTTWRGEYGKSISFVS